MAVVTQNQSDQENQNSQSGSAQSNTSGGNGAGVTTVVSGSKGGSSGGSSNAAPTVQNAQGSQNSAAPTPSSSGSFTNLKSYLNANNNGQNLTGQINNNLSQQGQQLQTNVNNASHQFNQQAQSVVNPISTAYGNFSQNGGSTGDASAITKYAGASNDNSNSIKNLENSSYTGPKSFNDLSGSNNGNSIQGNINNYSGLANSAGTEAGRFSLLQNMFGGQGYTQGQQTLDNAFIDPHQLNGARSTANQVQNSYNQAANNASNQAQNYQNKISDYANGTVNALNNAVSGANPNSAISNINNSYQTALNTQNGNFNQYTKNLQSGKISQDEAKALGLTSGLNIYNVDPSSYLTKNADLTTNNTATTQDYAQIAALNELLGTKASAPSSEILQQYATQQAPTITPDKYLNYNASGLQTAAQNAGQQYQDAINNGPYGGPISGWINNYLPNLAAGSVHAMGGYNLTDPATFKTNTFAQMGITPESVQANVAHGAASDAFGGKPYQDFVNYYKGQGYSTGAALSPDQQAQIASLQKMTANGGYPNNIQSQIDAINNSGTQYINDPNFYKNVNPLQYYLNNLNNPNLETAWQGAPGAVRSIDALGALQGYNDKYNPTKQLQIIPDGTS